MKNTKDTHTITRVIDPLDLIWLAGLLEGEGSFDAHCGKYPRLRLAMTDRDVVGRAATLMGVPIRMRLRPFGHQAIFTAELTGSRAVDILWQLLPHMGARRSQKIGSILAIYKLRDGKGMPGPALEKPCGIG